QDPYSIEAYAKNPVKVFFNTCMISLAEIVNLTEQPMRCTLFGFNGMPTFLAHQQMEVCVWRPEDRPELERACKALNTKFTMVDDRVGLVTPRVICMIINEAYYTVQEGTASREDI